MSEGIKHNPNQHSGAERVAPPSGELRRIETYKITRETLDPEGETFYLGPEARITIQRSEESPTGLEIYSPFAANRNTPLKPGLNYIGRAENCDVVINVPTVSRYHLEVNLQEETMYVTDNDSINGTRIEA